MRLSHSALTLGLLGLGLVGGIDVAHADVDVPRADKLFEEGRALMGTDLHAACAKFAESLQLNPQAIGTLLNVALCDEKLGRVASAVAKFTEARDRAREQGLEPQQQAAEERLAELVPKVPHVTLKLAAALPPGTRILLDDNRVISPSTLTDLPIDPGEHPLTVSAPEHLAFQTTIRIAIGEHRDVEIPALARAVDVRSKWRTIGKITAASGAGALGAGIVLGLVARSHYRAQFDAPASGGAAPCVKLSGGALECNTAGYAATNSARTLGNVGTAVGIVGVAAVGIGAYLWLRPSSGRHATEASERRVTVVPQLGPAEAGFVAVGRF